MTKSVSRERIDGVKFFKKNYEPKTCLAHRNHKTRQLLQATICGKHYYFLLPPAQITIHSKSYVFRKKMKSNLGRREYYTNIPNGFSFALIKVFWCQIQPPQCNLQKLIQVAMILKIGTQRDLTVTCCMLHSPKHSKHNQTLYILQKQL